MKFSSLIKHGERGQVLILTLIILALGSLIIAPLLNFLATGARATAIYQDKLMQYYACDAGIEDAAHKMLKNTAAVEALADGESLTYVLPAINGLPVTVTLSKASLLDGLLGSDEYKIGQPHSGWVQYDVPINQAVRNYVENWVEYHCTLDFTYTGGGNRMIETVGVFFSPFPGDSILIGAPLEIIYVPVMTPDYLESLQTKVVTGGFAYIFRWEDANGPRFTPSASTGSLDFKFRVSDADWEYRSTFMWCTFKEQDVSYLTNSQLQKWVIRATAGQTVTTVQALADACTGSVTFLTWERN